MKTLNQVITECLESSNERAKDFAKDVLDVVNDADLRKRCEEVTGLDFSDETLKAQLEECLATTDEQYIKRYNEAVARDKAKYGNVDFVQLIPDLSIEKGLDLTITRCFN